MRHNTEKNVYSRLTTTARGTRRRVNDEIFSTRLNKSEISQRGFMELRAVGHDSAAEDTRRGRIKYVYVCLRVA